LRGAQLLIPRSWAVALGADEYYYYQLLGLDVVTITGESLGKIMEIWPTGANDVYETPLALIPATKDMIRSIDFAHGRMVVDARPGLKKNESGE
jgi:16S rRNA processing protein RimM